MATSPERPQLTPGAVLVRGTVTCNGGLSGKSLRVDGLETTVTDVLVRIQHADGRLESHMLKPTNPSVTLGEQTSLWQRSASYLRLGIEHILMGVDHLLFVLGLLLIVVDRRMLVTTITSFRCPQHHPGDCHVRLRERELPLNAAIALSILFLGPEVIRRERGQTSLTIRRPWIVAFAFGLLHGFGFASGLTATGLPGAEIPLALLLFNLGVEIGQIFFVLLMLMLARSFRKLEIVWPRPVEALPGYAVGSLGAYWTMQRTLMLLGA
jgi:hypothetical protein